MFYYLTFIYICVYMVQRNLIVNCQSTTVDPSVSLQPSSVFGLAFTNTQSPAQFNSLLTKSVDSKITESMYETNQLTISSSTSTQQKISTSLSSLSQSVDEIKNSDFVEQLSSSINENDIVPSKTILSDVSEKSKLVDQSLALASSIQIMYASSSNDVYSSSSRSFGTTDLTSSSKDMKQITASHLSMGNDWSLSSTSSSSIVMVTAAKSLNTANIIQTSSTFMTSESNNIVVSTNSLTAVKETTQNVAISNFAQTSELTLMSSIFSGETTISQSKANTFTASIGTNILPTSVLESKSAVSIEISSTRQTFKSEHILESSIGIVSSNATHSLQTSGSLSLEQMSGLSTTTTQMTDTSAQSSMLAMTSILTKDSNSSVISSTIDIIPKTSNLNTVVPTISTQPSMHTVPLSDLSVTAPLTVSNLMESLSSTSSVQRIELTQSVVNETNILSSILEREITPSETFTVLTTPSGGSFISKIEQTASQDMMSITSSLVITTPQLNVSDFETKSLLSSDLRIFTSTMANSQSSSLEPTSQNVEQSTISTSLISTTSQTNISAFNTQSLLPSELGSSTFMTLGLVNQSSTPEMMQSSPTKNMSSLSIFDLGSTFSSDSIFLTLNVSNIQSSMPIFQTSDLINASDSSTFQILPTPVMNLSSDSSFMLNISNVQTSTTVDLSSEFLMFNATPTVISSTQTQNFSDSLLPDFVSTIFGSSQSLNQSENSINATSVSQSMYFPMTLTSDANFSSGTFLISSSSFPATLPMMNFSSSLELTNFTSDFFQNSSDMILTAATNLPTISLEKSNSSHTTMPIQSTLSSNVTTQPMKTTEFLSDLIMNVTATYITSDTLDILQSLNLSYSEMRSELTTVYMSRNDSGELTSVTILPNTTSDSVLMTSISDLNSIIDSTLPVIIQPTVAVSSQFTTSVIPSNDSVSGDLNRTIMYMNSTSDLVSSVESTLPVIIQPTMTISSSIILETFNSSIITMPSTSLETFNMSIAMTSTNVLSQESSSIDMKTDNMSALITPTVPMSSSDLISVASETSSNSTIVTVQPTVPVSSTDVISSSFLDTNNLTSSFIESSTKTTTGIFTLNFTSDFHLPSVTMNDSQTMALSSEFIQKSSENQTVIMSSTTVESSLTTTFMTASEIVNQTGIILSTTVEPSLTTTFMTASEIVNQTGIILSTTVEPSLTTTFLSVSEMVNQTGIMSSSTVQPGLTTSFMSSEENQTGFMSTTTVQPSLTTTFMTASEIVNQTGIMSSTTVGPSLATTFISSSEVVNLTGVMSLTIVEPSLTPVLSSSSEMVLNSSQYLTQSSGFTTIGVSTTEISKSVYLSTVEISSTITMGPASSSEPVVTLSTSLSSSIIPTKVPSSTESLTVSTSPSTMITSGVLTSTGVLSQTHVLTSTILSSSHVQMSSSVSMTTVASTTETSTTTPTTTTQPTTTTTPTTTTPPPTTTPDVKATYWVKTGILVPVTEEVNTVTFKTKVETGLANAYDLAFQKQGQARRRKRFVQIGKAGINVTDITRAAGKEDVTVGYTVDKDGTTLPATEAVAATSSISDQMMAIKLGYEVSSKAETYISQEPATDDTPSNLWIVGAVVGAIAFVVIVIWIVVCIIYWKYKRAPTKGRPLDSENDPPLLRMRSPTGAEEDEAQYDHVTGTAANGRAAYKVTSPKKEKYEVNQEEDLYAVVKKPSKKKPDAESMNIVTEYNDTTKEKTKKKKKRSSQAVAGLEEPDENSPKLIRTKHLQKYEPQIDDDLKESKEAERKKNKQRLREKRKKREKDQEAMKEYLSGQEEIDAVLGHSTDEVPDVFIHKPKKKKGTKDKEGKQNDGFVEDESLREARHRMHRLLDDAFALISPAESMNDGEGTKKVAKSATPIRKFTHRNKVSPENKMQTKQGEDFLSDNSSVFEYIFRADDLKAQSEKKHEPMFVHTNHTPQPETLQTWSPYRAADQVALISMPNSMQTSLGRDFNKKSPGKRPVANVNYNGPTLTTEPPKPILLRTMDLDKSGGPHEHRKSGNYEPNRSTMLNDIGATKSSNLSGLKSSHIGSKGPSQQSVEMKNLNGNVSHSKPHRPHSKTSKDMDETDIVTTNLSQREATPDQTIQSIRDELRSIVNSNKTPSKTRHSMADIS